MKRNGQALVEFIIVMPIMLFILLAIVDFGNYSYNKNKIEGLLNNVNSMYLNNKSIDDIKDYITKNDNNIVISITEENEYITLKLSKVYDFLTPGMDKIIKDNNITVERVVYNEKK